MRIFILIACGALCYSAAGCGSFNSAPAMSKLVSSESVEFKQGWAEQDNYVREAKEAERRAMGGNLLVAE